jgi:hypothetical protein
MCWRTVTYIFPLWSKSNCISCRSTGTSVCGPRNGRPQVDSCRLYLRIHSNYFRSSEFYNKLDRLQLHWNTLDDVMNSEQIIWVYTHVAAHVTSFKEKVQCSVTTNFISKHLVNKPPVQGYYNSGEITNKMQPCNRIYYSTVHWRLNMFRAAHRSSSGVLTVFAASGLHTHVVTGRSQAWVALKLHYGRSPHTFVNQRLQIQLELLMLKHVEPSMNGGIINSIARLHLVGYFSLIILRCTDPWILKGYYNWLSGFLTTCHTQYTWDNSMYLHRWIKKLS